MATIQHLPDACRPADGEGEPPGTSRLADALKLSALDDHQQLPPDPSYFIGAALGDPLSDNHRGVLAMPVDHYLSQEVELFITGHACPTRGASQPIQKTLAQRHAATPRDTLGCMAWSIDMCVVFAEFERGMITERIHAGLKRAKDHGKILGRPRVPAELEQRVRAELSKGHGIIKVAKAVAVGNGTVQRIKDETAAA
jgi:hypothetical protein